ncbi:MAG: hypothetical protein NVS9B2_16210 [Steroidobacteraceae bacterium]
MSQYVFRMPDLGEGTVDAEIVAWHTRPGDAVAEDQLIVEVMTDKAAVEVPAPVSGRVVSITGAPGDKVAVGSPLIVFDVGETSASNVEAVQPRRNEPSGAPGALESAAVAVATVAASPATRPGRVMASPRTHSARRSQVRRARSEPRCRQYA